MLHSICVFGNIHSTPAEKAECGGISALFFNCGKVQP